MTLFVSTADQENVDAAPCRVEAAESNSTIIYKAVCRGN